MPAYASGKRLKGNTPDQKEAPTSLPGPKGTDASPSYSAPMTWLCRSHEDFSSLFAAGRAVDGRSTLGDFPLMASDRSLAIVADSGRFLVAPVTELPPHSWPLTQGPIFPASISPALRSPIETRWPTHARPSPDCPGLTPTLSRGLLWPHGYRAVELA